MTLARVWIALAALCSGTALAAGTPAWMVWAAAGAGAGALAIRRRPLLGVVGLAAVAFAAGAVGGVVRSMERLPLKALAVGVPSCDFSGRVLEQAGGLGTLVELAVASCDARGQVVDGGAVIVDGTIGDAGAPIHGRGWLVPLGESSFGRAQERAGAAARLDIEQVEVSPVPPGPLAVAAALRGGVRTTADGIGGRRGALLLGLTIGDTSRVDGATIELFRDAGLSHLLAVSGSNVAIVVGALALLAQRLALRSRLAVALAGLVLFVLVVGPDPSVLRAAIMGGIAVVALVWGRPADPLHTLGLALIAVIAIRPGMIHSVGLHLSAAATAGIVLWTRRLAGRLDVLPSVVAIPLAATLAAQWAVAPIVIATFGRISIVGPVANVLAIAAVVPATVLGLAGGVVDALVAGWGSALAQTAAPFAGWILAVGDAFGGRAWSAVAVPRWWAIVLAIPVVVSAGRELRRQARVTV
ncbi:MAG: ComEC/Rec2 family competence protein [Actinomycetota bacterium]